MSALDAVREVRLVLTVERFDQAVLFYRGRLGLLVVEERQRAAGSGIILALGPHTTLELFDASQAGLIDVFAQEPLNGHPLALVIDALELSQQTKQPIAREFNQLETTALKSERRRAKR